MFRKIKIRPIFTFAMAGAVNATSNKATEPKIGTKRKGSEIWMSRIILAVEANKDESQVLCALLGREHYRIVARKEHEGEFGE